MPLHARAPGREFSGTVSAVTGFGLFVTLDSLYVEGLVHITELGGEYYRFDECARNCAASAAASATRSARGCACRSARVDLDGRRIDFRMVREGGTTPRACVRKRERKPCPSGGAEEELERVKSADRAVKAGAKDQPRSGQDRPSAEGREVHGTQGGTVRGSKRR